MEALHEPHGAPAAGVESSGHSELSFVEALAHPAEMFGHPREVANHPWFSHQEKRTILLSWVRDALLLEQVASHTVPELRRDSRIEAVIDALSAFDPLAAGEYVSALRSIRNDARAVALVDRSPKLGGRAA
jgi:hypothetical protein